MPPPSPTAHSYQPYIAHDATGYPMLPGGGLSAVIDTAANGDNVIVAAQSGFSVYVYNYLFIASQAGQTVRWKDGPSTSLSGGMNPAQFGGAAPDTTPPGFLFKTSPGNALVLNLGSASQVSGHVSYWVGQ